MGRVYDQVFSKVLVRMDAEKAHHLTYDALRAGGPLLQRAPVRGGGRPVQVMGLTFPNRLGLAPGFDKTAQVWDRMGAFGFGHVEIGTVTALAQPGNPTPRLFRLPQDHAILNRMGFNNDGATVIAQRLARRKARNGLVLGVNIGKSKVVPEDDQQAVEADYETSTRLLAPHADYLVVNVSSPNTPGLRSLQAVERLAPLLGHVRSVADQASSERQVPLLVKIAPDLADDDVLAVADMAVALGLSGIVATNTTISRAGLSTPAADVDALGAGGISGAPLRERAEQVLRLLRARVGEQLTLIGVGGISTPEDAVARVRAGADLVQVYSGLIYGGPGWPRQLVRGLEGS